jgi:CRP/FNR family transcriptional regulator, cyclic AMP receptor protein
MSQDSLFSRFGKSYSKGSVIYEENQSGEQIFIIQEGEVKISRKIGPDEHIMFLLNKGDFFGEMAIFADKPRTSTATAMSDTKLIVLDRSPFEQMIRENKEIGVRIIKKLAGRLEDAELKIENLLIPDPVIRVVHIIFKSARRILVDSDKGIKIDLELSMASLASLAGLDEQIVIEILNKLKRSGVIFEKAGRIFITSMGMLEKYMKYLEMKNQFEEDR